MQIRKMRLMLAALGAMSMVLAGCPDGGRESLECTTDADCDASEICHPDAKVCVQTCTAAADCPDSAKKCEALSSSDTRQICKCTTPELCQQDERVSDASNLTCSGQYSVCVPSGTTGPGPTPTTCSGEGQSTCAYGQFCSTGTCTVVPAPTCQNYERFDQRGDLGTTGPIIFKATETAAVETYCSPSAPKRVKVTISAYSSNPFPATKDELNGLFWVDVDGDKHSGAAVVAAGGSNYVVSGTNRERADIVLSFCVAESSRTLSLGVYFMNGNFFCHQANY
ncbi:hypothetical protein [Archangium violaceum]|uniref:hypothetical protein n=1 Tax=Archangium violaceum TaxID=83451 RepID=UPI001EF076B9|nr:hypothetical protein [Archangium violaceum]